MADNNKKPNPMSEIINGIKDIVENPDLAGVVEGKYRLRSIAERAKRCVMMYRVGMSSSIGQISLASDISKYLETIYATFTLINLGLNPFLSSNKDVNELIDNISAESYNPESVENFDTNKYITRGMTEYGYKKSSISRIGRHATSTEADTLKDDIAKGIYDAMKMDDAEKNKKNKLKEEAINEYEKELANKKVTGEFAKKLEGMSVNAYPTTINLRVRDTNIPILIKANCYGIISDELAVMLETAMAGKPYSYLRFAKWRSGEISTIEYLFNTDLAKKDAQLKKKLGKNPWYIDLLNRKNYASMNIFSKFILNSGSKDPSKNVDGSEKLNGIKDLPPTASLIVTKNDLVAATKLGSSHFVKNEGFVKTIMKNLYLLCFGIVDEEAETVTFFFRGYTQPFYQKFSELAKGSKDPNQALFETFRELARKI